MSSSPIIMRGVPRASEHKWITEEPTPTPPLVESNIKSMTRDEMIMVGKWIIEALKEIDDD